MSRKYTRLYSDVAFQQGMPNAQPSVQVGANKMHVVRVKAPSEGRLTSLSVKQTETEAQVSIQVEVLKSLIPWPAVDQDIAAATAAADSVSLYRIILQQAAAPGFPIEIDEESPGFAYRNIDGNYTNNQRYIYIVLAPGGIGVGATASSWKIAITVESEVG